MRNILSYDEIIAIIKDDLGTEFEKNRFAISAIAARIHEELVVWSSLNRYLKRIEDGETLEPKEMNSYFSLSNHGQSLAAMIIRAVKDLKIEDSKAIKSLMKKVNEGMLGSGKNETEANTEGDRTAPDNS